MSVIILEGLVGAGDPVKLTIPGWDGPQSRPRSLPASPESPWFLHKMASDLFHLVRRGADDKPVIAAQTTSVDALCAAKRLLNDECAQ